MVALAYITALGLSAVAVLAAPANQPSLAALGPRQALTSSTSGTNNGYYYELYVSNGDGVQYINGPGGEYTVGWGPATDSFIAGKGWNPGWEQ
jgi:endo-1,4-beta-xylanase